MLAFRIDASAYCSNQIFLSPVANTVLRVWRDIRAVEGSKRAVDCPSSRQWLTDCMTRNTAGREEDVLSLPEKFLVCFHMRCAHKQSQQCES